MMGWYLLVAAIAATLGFLLGIFPGWFLIGPLLHARAVVNGAPFHEGDVVRIITGPYRGTVAQVYSGWQGDSVRVELGASARKDYKDIFIPTEILRVSDAKPDARTNGEPAQR